MRTSIRPVLFIVLVIVCGFALASIGDGTASTWMVPAALAGENPEARIQIFWMVTPPGQQLVDYFPTYPPLRVIKILVMGKVGLPATDADLYIVMNMDAVVLDDEKSLTENGVQDGDRLMLYRR